VLDRIRIHGFRAARDVSLAPGPLCVLVGEASSGKSTVLSAVWALLDAAAPVPALDDVSAGSGGRIHLEAEVGGRTIFLDANPPATVNLNREGAPPTLYAPTGLRDGPVVARPSTRQAAKAAQAFRSDTSDGGLALVAGVEALCDTGARGLVVLIEEPELYLGPHRLEELALVRHDPRRGTTVLQPSALSDRESFRAFTELDAERAELFLARAALLVEGRSEKLAFPFVFEAVGADADREAVAIVDCGGKGNLPLYARICNECGIPYIVAHDRDAPRGKRPVESERVTNRRIAEAAGRRRTVQLVPDFEAGAGLRGRREKAEQAWRHFSTNGGTPPEQLAEAVRRVVRAARR
jgi:hypothetical protein